MMISIYIPFKNWKCLVDCRKSFIEFTTVWPITKTLFQILPLSGNCHHNYYICCIWTTLIELVHKKYPKLELIHHHQTTYSMFRMPLSSTGKLWFWWNKSLINFYHPAYCSHLHYVNSFADMSSKTTQNSLSQGVLLLNYCTLPFLGSWQILFI